MVICPRGLAVLMLTLGLAACGSTTTAPNDDGSTQDVTGGDPSDVTIGGDTSSNGDHNTSGDNGSPDTVAHICKDVYDKIISCCSTMAYKTQTKFMSECEADPFTAQQRDQFVAQSCEALAPMCSIGNACPAGLSCYQVGVGVGVCADHGYYPADATSCAQSTDCNSGLACYGDGATNYCVQTCIPAGDGFTVGQCPTGLTCVRLVDGTHVCGDGDSVPSGAPQCATRDDCDSGWSCVVAASGDATGYCLEQCIGN